MGIDARVPLLLTEAYPHGKALGTWDGGAEALGAAGIALDAPGVVITDDAGTALEGVLETVVYRGRRPTAGS
ncbi:hypothetical protein [Streptomyces sp. NPDC002580]|uniref:hypothetical protein n=1 Tax=Streptomyces sp. NPDC002580 TaxID=3364653 RepID=UPI00369F1F3A